jgi:hypothetical protein
MKILMRLRKANFYSLLILLLLLASVFTLSNTVVFSAVGDPPTIVINSPTTDAILDNKIVEISGTYMDENVQPSGLIFTMYEITDGNDVKISDSDMNSAEWKLSNSVPNGSWTFTKKLQEGIHFLKVEIKEKPTETNKTTSSIAFTIDTRPYISGTGIVLADNTEKNGEDLTSVPQDAKIKITLSDSKPMNQLINQMESTTDPYNPVKVKLGATQIPGTSIITEKGNQSGKYVYDIIFTPSTPFTVNSTYLVYIDPGLKDDSNNKVFARFFKFTTKSNMNETDNPHGHYTNNTSMCANCHSTHIGKNPSLEGGIYETTFSEQLSKDQPPGDPSSNYCMACHDGTMNAPIIDKINSNYQHSNPANYSDTKENALRKTDSCTSCHNPHLERIDTNPNLLRDHFVYTHNAEDAVTPKKIDSLDKQCYSCHDDDAIFDQTNYPGTYEVFSYKKSFTTQGNSTDYSLCIRCHNTAKKALDDKITDIEQYYNDTGSGHFFALPEGEQTQDDGSKLNGPIPCAECHDTHGSNNIKMLREELGNIQRSDKFTTTSQIWSASDERQFCLKCHNNTTEIYGKTGVFKEKDDLNQPITGHQPTDSQSCSQCHGTGTTAAEKALSATHAPKINP